MPGGANDRLRDAKRLLKFRLAQDSFIDFCQVMKPDPGDPDNSDASLFQANPHNILIAQALEKVERGECLRYAVSMPPQHGKSEEISRLFPPWLVGRKPWLKIMFGTYSQDFANDFGGAVREIIQSEQYKVLFPGTVLRGDSKAKDMLGIKDGGQLAFLGRGGAGTGKPADIFIIDDPIKDDEEAQSPTIREKVWQWFTKVAYTRCHAMSAIVIVHTRWHEDDLIGRLLDKDHPDHDPEIAKDWAYISIPAVITDPELADALGLALTVPTNPRIIAEFGEKPMCALWESRFSLEHLASAHRLNPRGFNALYQGRPSSEEGDYFRKEQIVPYKPDELPKNLRIYSASDHALSQKQQADPSVIGSVGVDEDDHIWILPDLIWDKIPTDRAVEEMIRIMRDRKPTAWFCESDLIKKSIGPFLRKRMREEKVYTPIFEMSTTQGDKPFKARSIQGRMQMHMIHFPVFAPWFHKAYNELLKFPNGAHDDFVDFLALIGLGLANEQGASASNAVFTSGPEFGTFTWLLAATKWNEQQSKYAEDQEGW